jgi:hypothetical protein
MAQKTRQPVESMNETTLHDAAMTHTLPDSGVVTTKDAPAIQRALWSVNPTMKFDAAALAWIPIARAADAVFGSGTPLWI